MSDSIALQSWIDEAVAAAMLSPCQSKRGVVIANKYSRLISSGFNDQPYPFRCDGTSRLKIVLDTISRLCHHLGE